jgi:hypothetical protein
MEGRPLNVRDAWVAVSCAPTGMNPVESGKGWWGVKVAISCCSHRDKPGGKRCAVKQFPSPDPNNLSLQPTAFSLQPTAYSLTYLTNMNCLELISAQIKSW